MMSDAVLDTEQTVYTMKTNDTSCGGAYEKTRDQKFNECSADTDACGNS